MTSTGTPDQRAKCASVSPRRSVKCACGASGSMEATSDDVEPIGTDCEVISDEVGSVLMEVAISSLTGIETSWLVARPESPETAVRPKPPQAPSARGRTKARERARIEKPPDPLKV